MTPITPTQDAVLCIFVLLFTALFAVLLSGVLIPAPAKKKEHDNE